MYDQARASFRPREKLREVFKETGHIPSKEIIADIPGMFSHSQNTWSYLTTEEGLRNSAGLKHRLRPHIAIAEL